jgi:hypothetical protein
MAIKSEISWRRTDADGNRVEVYARRFGGDWRFHQRARRNDLWQAIKEPIVEDWIALIDALERRVPRRLTKPDEVERVRQLFHQKHPEARQS